MKFEVIDKKNGKVLDIDETSQMSVDTAGRLCGNDSLSGLYALDPLKYEARFPEHEAVKAKLEKERAKNEKWEKFYEALPDYVDKRRDEYLIYPFRETEHKEYIARECGLEVRK